MLFRSGGETPVAVRETDVTDSGKGAVGQRAASGRDTGFSPGKPKDKTNDDNSKTASSSAHIPESMDTQPTMANPKLPPLRRAALHFLSLLMHSLIARAYEAQDVDDAFTPENVLGVDLPDAIMRRGATVLKYVSSTDVDEVVRVMAREAAELLEQLRRALLGLSE